MAIQDKIKLLILDDEKQFTEELSGLQYLVFDLRYTHAGDALKSVRQFDQRSHGLFFAGDLVWPFHDLFAPVVAGSAGLA